MTLTPTRSTPGAGIDNHPGARPRWASRSRRDAIVRLGAGLGLWLILLLVAYWWASLGGFQDLTGWATGLLSTGRLTGLIASALLLVQVLLMARVPLLERAFGQDQLAKIHRIVGFTSFNLMIAHIGLITWGYAAGRITDTPTTIWDLTWDYPGMLLAVAGTLCLVMVVVTSIKAARRRLRYESWHLLHLYAYLGAGLALPHQLWTGQEFLSLHSSHRLLVVAVGCGCCCSPDLAHRLAAPSQQQTSPQGHLGPPRGRRFGVGLSDRSGSGRADRGSGPVLHLALP